MSKADEMRRLNGDQIAEPVDEFLIRVAVTAKNPQGVVERVREVLRVVVPLTAAELDAEAERPTLLPTWFVEGCAPEPSADEAARWLSWWRGLDPEERAQAESEEPWTLADWLYWATPGERQWSWWGVAIQSAETATVVVVVEGWPAPLGALRWLLKVAGAQSVEVPG